MARSRRPPNPAAQAAAAQRNAANAAARAASQYWQQRAGAPRPAAAPAAPGGQGAAPAADPAAPAAPAFNQSWYDSWLQNYQPYQGAVSGIAGQRTAEIGNMGAQIARALGLFGSQNGVDVAGLLNQRLAGVGYGDQIAGAINADANGDGVPDWQNAATAADQGGVSTMAQLQKAQADRQASLESDLANRGIFWSGQNTAATNQNNTQRTQDEYSARQQLVDYLTGLSSAFAQNEAGRAAGINQAGTDAYTYYMQNPDMWTAPPGTAPGSTPSTNPAAGSAAPGQPVSPADYANQYPQAKLEAQRQAEAARLAASAAAGQRNTANRQAANAAAAAAQDAARARRPRRPKKRPPAAPGNTIVVV